MIHIQNFINGTWQDSISKQSFPFYNPAEAIVIGNLPDSEAQDVEQAVQAAQNVFPIWSKMAANERSKILYKINELLVENLAAFAQAETQNTGKPISLSRSVDIPRSAQNFEFFSQAITQFSSESHDMPHLKTINYTLRRPIGVVGCISPWNLPLYLFTWKIAPAIAAGNTVVAKPSEVTPHSAFLLSKIVKKAGLPDGVLNIVHGFGHKVGEAIVSHPLVKAVSFTGSTKVGKQISAICANQLKKVSLELGGKNPNIIFADCDFEKAVSTTVNSSFRNQGQICLCGSRILIEASIYDTFKNAFVEKTKQLKIGNPMDEQTQVGSVVSKTHYEKIITAIQTAVSEGGRILCGGTNNPMQNGYFVTPTIIENLDMNCQTNQEEIFGPVVTITPFHSKEEAISLANNTDYGLSATVWTRDLHKAHHVAEQIQSGIVWVNCWMVRDLRTPFGGVKNSGLGREGGLEALRFFTEPKNVCIDWG
ncbi:MAG: aldehyde dehydrogenase [Saprospiraceae bacterium]